MPNILHPEKDWTPYAEWIEGHMEMDNKVFAVAGKSKYPEVQLIYLNIVRNLYGAFV